MDGTKLTIAGIVGGVPAVLAGAMGANLLIDMAIAGMFGYIAWEFSPELQRQTAKFLPHITADRLPVINRVDWKGVFAGESEVVEEHAPHDAQPEAIEENEQPAPHDTRTDEGAISDEQITTRLREIGVSDEVVSDWLGKDEPVSFGNEEMGTFGRKETGIFFFSELLATGWRPSWKEIFVGRTMQGKNIFVSALDLCHVALAGKTGGGKGSLMRLIMVQLCYIGAPVALLNPDYMRWVKAKEGEAFDEDWSPFERKNPRTDKPYLEQSPIECAEMPMINKGLKWAATELLESRRQRARTQKVDFVPYFIVIDEWPAVVDALGKSAPAYLAKLLRDGRKYRIYVIIASQDFQVETIGIEGKGSIRKSLLTVFYTGGDLTTRRELLNEVTRETPENKIGKGTILMRCTGTQNEVVLARVPFVDNEAVYTLLGPSTYEDREVDTEALEVLNDEESVEALKAMPYPAYLQSKHWQRQRREARSRANDHCQVCNSGVQLEVHHRTYDRLGCELPTDLFVLCYDCHDLFSKNGKLAKEPVAEDLPRIVDTTLHHDAATDDEDLLSSSSEPTEPEQRKNEHVEIPDSPSSSSSPDGWTEEDILVARRLARTIKDKDKIITLLDKKGTIRNLRDELKQVLGQGEMVDER